MNVIIIGGGIAGISAAIRLKKFGINSTIIDKGKAIGGRASTRRITYDEGKTALFDYGAPHFRIKSEDFEDMVMFLISNFVLRISNRDGYYPPNTTYRGSKSMREIPIFLSKELTVIQNKKVVFLNPSGKYTEVITEDGSSYFGDAVILTQPVPQSLQLFENSKLEIPVKLKTNLGKIEYAKILTAMILVDGHSEIRDSGFEPVNRNGIKYIIDNNKRRISKGPLAITIAADENFSDSNFDKPDEEVIDEMIRLSGDYIKGNVFYKNLHKWKYAYPTVFYKKAFEFINAPAPFVLAGDAFMDGTIEGAFLSGKTAAEYIVGHKDNIESNVAIAKVK